MDSVGIQYFEPETHLLLKKRSKLKNFQLAQFYSYLQINQGLINQAPTSDNIKNQT
jgi:hypothetical protein